MVSLINAVRVEAGASTLGFLNPAIYQTGAAAKTPFNDITSGENQCTADGAVCCSEGFHAAKGWDPTTGFGSVDFTALKAALTADVPADKLRAAEARLNAKMSAAGVATPNTSAPPEAAPAAQGAPAQAAPVLGAAAAPSAPESLSTAGLVALGAAGSAAVGAALVLASKRLGRRGAATEAAPALSYSALTSPLATA